MVQQIKYDLEKEEFYIEDSQGYPYREVKTRLPLDAWNLGKEVEGLCAIIVIVSARMMVKRPLGHVTWGILILIFSIVGWLALFMLPDGAKYVGVAGIFVFGLWGILNGIRAIRYKPDT
jgi:hypothetical protein